LRFYLSDLYHYRIGLAYYFSFRSNKTITEKEAKRISDVRFSSVGKTRRSKESICQNISTISWSSYVDTIEHPLHLFFIHTVERIVLTVSLKENWFGQRKSNDSGRLSLLDPTKLTNAELFIKNGKIA
jgi:lysozyme